MFHKTLKPNSKARLQGHLSASERRNEKKASKKRKKEEKRKRRRGRKTRNVSIAQFFLFFMVFLYFLPRIARTTVYSCDGIGNSTSRFADLHDFHPFSNLHVISYHLSYQVESNCTSRVNFDIIATIYLVSTPQSLIVIVLNKTLA